MSEKIWRWKTVNLSRRLMFLIFDGFRPWRLIIFSVPESNSWNLLNCADWSNTTMKNTKRIFQWGENRAKWTTSCDFYCVFSTVTQPGWRIKHSSSSHTAATCRKKNTIWLQYLPFVGSPFVCFPQPYYLRKISKINKKEGERMKNDDEEDPEWK